MTAPLHIRRPARPNRRAPALRWAALLGLIIFAAGCRATNSTPMVLYLDGAGWYGSHRSFEAGLRRGGYTGRVQNFTWTSFLGPGADHLLAARSGIPARRLAGRIREIRRHSPQGKIHLVGRSSGSAVVIQALEQLPPGVEVDHVLFLQSSVSPRRNLADALEHVRGRMYATTSRHDMLLAAMTVCAEGELGPPAGRTGFLLPRSLSESQKRLYAKLILLPWRPAYAALGWDGGHFHVTRKDFVEHVIAPRLLSDQPFPLDRPLVFVESQRQTAATPRP
ncbi:MAG TPA: hypothetical protein VM243_14000 [Phycisphaerae bacterium]|nr:hypothetical protein [Phycisphaerae bacterium]